MTVADIASWLKGELVGDGTREITRVAKIEEAGSADLTFLSNPRYEQHVRRTGAVAILVSRTFDIAKASAPPSLAFIRVDDPYLAFLEVLKRLTPSLDPFGKGIHATAVISPTATLGTGVDIGAYAVIGDGARIGGGTRIAEGCVVGTMAEIGGDCRLFPHVTIYHQCRVGNRVTIHAGTVIGSDGFGFAPKPDGAYEKIPQLGIVVIEDDVEIGSNCSIDRATMGETLIMKGVKLDNLIQVAHNVVIGENTVIAAQTGISGSTKLGKNLMVAGQVGFAGHLEVADRTVIMAQSGIPESITEPGKTYFGYPAKERNRAFRIEAVIRSLPELAREVASLTRRMDEVLKKLESKS
ncbi:MAG: UDP-3-O-(3-hydroxymyristoyl)glucosamine N-acyltransferase [Ignavibacteriales bacterium]|nr:UDP-3-O-(3-hydroxymyristoyl)glucosamine N-acyltransferase [Ignavibacteriales bacterium]